MKIGYFVGHFPYKDFFENSVKYSKRYHYDGGINVAYNLALSMAKRGHEINVFTTSIDFGDAVERYKDISIYRYGTKFRIASGNFSFNLFLKPIRHKVDVIHIHVGNPIADLAGYMYAKKKKNTPFIITYHGDAEEGIGGFIRNTNVSLYNKYVFDKVLSYADVIISPSESFIDESRFLGEYRNKIVIIPNGININDFDLLLSKEDCKEKIGLPIDENVILSVGNLSPIKGPDVLVRAMPKIIKSIPNAKLIFVGAGILKEELEELSKNLDMEKHVKFAGFIGNTFKKALYYRLADVFVLPSTKIESFGIVNLEAMASRTPIVASKLGAIPDVVKDGENGLLVPPGDPEKLADAIIYLLENEEVRNKMSKNARRKVADYSWGRIAEKMEKVYNEVIS